MSILHRIQEWGHEVVGSAIRGSATVTKNVVVCRRESDVIPGEILWEDWTVNPTWVVASEDGGVRIRGVDHVLRDSALDPLPREVVQEAQHLGRWLLFRNHPHVKGLVLVEMVGDGDEGRSADRVG